MNTHRRTHTQAPNHARVHTHARAHERAATFCAFDVPMPGATRFGVHFLVQSPETRTAVAEQSRIWVGDAWEPWQEKLNFYAYPAPTLLFEAQ